MLREELYSTSSPDPGVTTETSGKSCAKKRESFANTHTDTHTHYGVLYLEWLTYYYHANCSGSECEECDGETSD